MSIQGRIDVDNTFGNQTLRIALGAAVYVVTLRYNSRMDRWLIDIADANLNPLVQGRVLQGAWPAFQRFSGVVAGLPVGFIYALDNTGAGGDPQENTLGGDCPLYYWEP
jgi:hypothetical protein